MKVGMVVPGIVTNITRFGAFVDIGVKQDGLVHVSEISDRFISDPGEVLKLNDKLLVKVMEVDTVRKRIALSIKQAEENKPRTKVNASPPPKDKPVPAAKEKKQTSASMEDALLALKMKFKS
jgi:protein Tex